MQPSFPAGLSLRIWPSQAAKLHHCAQWVQSKPHSDDLSLKSQTRAPHRSAETSSGFTSGSRRSWSAFGQWVITAVSAAQHHLCSLLLFTTPNILWNNPPVTYFRYCSHPPTLISPQSLVISGPWTCNHSGTFIFLIELINTTSNAFDEDLFGSDHRLITWRLTETFCPVFWQIVFSAEQHMCNVLMASSLFQRYKL